MYIITFSHWLKHPLKHANIAPGVAPGKHNAHILDLCCKVMLQRDVVMRKNPNSGSRTWSTLLVVFSQSVMSLKERLL